MCLSITATGAAWHGCCFWYLCEASRGTREPRESAVLAAQFAVAASVAAGHGSPLHEAHSQRGGDDSMKKKAAKKKGTKKKAAKKKK